MRHFKDPKFRPLFDALPQCAQVAANKSFALLKRNPKHPSLHFKRIKDDLWSVRVGRATGRWRSRGRTASSGSGLELMLIMID
jgi:hypothetical protein